MVHGVKIAAQIVEVIHRIKSIAPLKRSRMHFHTQDVGSTVFSKNIRDGNPNGIPRIAQNRGRKRKTTSKKGQGPSESDQERSSNLSKKGFCGSSKSGSVYLNLSADWFESSKAS